MGDWQDIPIPIQPGLYKEATGASVQGRWIDGSNVRFWKGFAQRIGGWAKLITSGASTYPARGAAAWRTLSSVQYVGYGTANKLHLMAGATVYDITPTSDFTAGNANGATEFGWGDGGWGSSPFGGSATLYATTLDPLTWTLSNWGEDLIACPRGQAIFLWDASVGTGTPAARISGSPPTALGIFISDVDRTLVAYGAHSGYASTVTITIASPGVITWTAHGHSNGTGVVFTTTGALPTGLTAGVTYYIVNASTNTFQVAATVGGTAINTSGSQSGTHTATTGENDPLLVRWSNSEDYNTWRPAATNTSGDLRCEVGTRIIGAMPARGGYLICTDSAAYYMRYIGGSNVYSLVRISDGPTMISPHAGVQDAQGNTYWMGPKGFFVYDGTVNPLPCDVHKDVFDNINGSQRFKTYCGTIKSFNEVIWFYARTGSTEINACVAYNTVEKTWWQGTLARTSWVDNSIVADYPVGWAADGYIYAQEVGTTADGTAIDYVLESSDIRAEDGSLLRGRKLVPDYESIEGTHEVSLKVRRYSQSAEVTIGPFDVDEDTETIDCRHRGRNTRLYFSGSSPFRMGQFQARTRYGGQQQ